MTRFLITTEKCGGPMTRFLITTEKCGGPMTRFLITTEKCGGPVRWGLKGQTPTCSLNSEKTLRFS